MEPIKLLFTSLLSVGTLFVTAKLMGHKQVSQLDFFDYVCGITIGSIAAELATNLEAPWKPLTSLLLYASVSIALSFLSHKFPKSRKYLNGTPTILYCNGQLYRANLKKAKLDLSEFLLLCREQGYFDLTQIHTAIFEPNGKLSVLPVTAHRPATPSDLGLCPTQEHLATEVIMDGQILGENLRRLGRDENWLKKQLIAQGYRDASQVFLGVYTQGEDNLTLYAKKTGD